VDGLAANTARARLDAAAPLVDAWISSVEWPPFAPTHGSSCRNPWPVGQQWTFPREQNERLAVRANVTVHNRSGRNVHVVFEGDHFWAAGETYGGSDVIMTGAEVPISERFRSSLDRAMRVAVTGEAPGPLLM
jgi:hypothetical protein